MLLQCNDRQRSGFYVIIYYWEATIYLSFILLTILTIQITQCICYFSRAETIKTSESNVLHNVALL